VSSQPGEQLPNPQAAESGDPTSAAGPEAPAATGKTAPPMSGRWIMAIAAAGAVALLTVPMLINAARPGADEPRLASAHGATCESNGMAKLDFTVKDPTGAPMKLADYKGKVVLLNFWGTWCGPCKMEIPGFIELQDQYRGKGFVILGLAVEDTPDAVRAYASEARINYPLAMVQDDVEDAYGPIFGLPMSFVIARDGSICNKHLGPVSKEAVEQEIKSLM
jgi:thiol-disulfide isomerase/thioredoxin